MLVKSIYQSKVDWSNLICCGFRHSTSTSPTPFFFLSRFGHRHQELLKICLSSQFDTLCFSWCGWEGMGWLCVKQSCFLIHQLLRSAHLFKKNHPCLNLWNVASPAEPSSHHFLWLLAPGSQTPLSSPTRWCGGECGSCWFYAFKYAFITDKYVTFFSRHVQWSNNKRDEPRPKRKHF